MYRVIVMASATERDQIEATPPQGEHCNVLMRACTYAHKTGNFAISRFAKSPVLDFFRQKLVAFISFIKLAGKDLLARSILNSYLYLSMVVFALQRLSCMNACSLHSKHNSISEAAPNKSVQEPTCWKHGTHE